MWWNVTNEVTSLPRWLVAKYSGSAPRYTSYPTAAQLQSDFPGYDWPTMVRESAGKTGAFYVHVPFCHQLCYFCACHKVITRSRAPVVRYLQALVREIRLYGKLLGPRFTFDHLHFGGGTPNFLSFDELEKIVSTFREVFSRRRATEELSIELDPRTATPEFVQGLPKLGFTRISCGVQDFDPTVQNAINRRQSFEQTAELISGAREVGINSVSVDLIYGLPLQTMKGFRSTLEQVLDIRPQRIALYGYAHLPSQVKVQTTFRRHSLPTPDERIALFLTALEALRGAGYEYVGLDHFALSDDPLVSAMKSGALRRNFMGYTDRVGEPLFGLGPSAISGTEQALVQNEKDLSNYESLILDAGAIPITRGVFLYRDDQIRADIVQQLFCARRIDFEQLFRRWGIEFDSYFCTELSDLRDLEADGLIELHGSALEVTPQGSFFLRNIAMAFDSYFPQSGQARFSQAI